MFRCSFSDAYPDAVISKVVTPFVDLVAAEERAQSVPAKTPEMQTIEKLYNKVLLDYLLNSIYLFLIVPLSSRLDSVSGNVFEKLQTPVCQRTQYCGWRHGLERRTKCCCGCYLHQGRAFVRCIYLTMLH